MLQRDEFLGDGASSEIGAVYTDRLARCGYDLILVARNKAKLDGVAERIANATRRSVTVIAADLNDKTDLARIEAVLRTDASVTILVNNAGVGALEPLVDSNVDAMEAMIALNVRALTRLTYAVVPAIVLRGSGTIINITSAVAIARELLNGVYGGTKAFVLAFSQSLHKELAEKHVRIQAVLPSATATSFWDVAGGSVDRLPSHIVMRTEDLVEGHADWSFDAIGRPANQHGATHDHRVGHSDHFSGRPPLRHENARPTVLSGES